MLFEFQLVLVSTKKAKMLLVILMVPGLQKVVVCLKFLSVLVMDEKTILLEYLRILLLKVQKTEKLIFFLDCSYESFAS